MEPQYLYFLCIIARQMRKASKKDTRKRTGLFQSEINPGFNAESRDHVCSEKKSYYIELVRGFVRLYNRAFFAREIYTFSAVKRKKSV
jgi:hypothetical protein